MRSSGGLAQPTYQLKTWPALLDLLAATLIVFVLVTFVEKLLSIKELESLLVRRQQETFVRLAEELLRKEIEEGVVRWERDQNSIVFTFSDQLLFDSTDYHLKKQGRHALERFRLLFAESSRGFERVQVEGHTDSMALDRKDYPANNWQLSAARAISVVEFLVKDSRLEGKRFSANGYESFRPVADNSTPEGRALNRRIEMRIFFSGRPEETGRLAE